MGQTLGTTKLSSRGQVVIPLSIRQENGWTEGIEFVVVSTDDSVMLKVISRPSVEEFRALQKKLQAHAKKAGLKKADIAKAIRKVRGQE